MNARTVFISLATTVCSSSVVNALIVDPPRPITHRVTVQLVQTARDDGSEPATVFGDKRADVETAVDAIWAQAGVNIEFLPEIVRFNNTFVNRGDNGNGTRPIGDLNLLLADAVVNEIWHPDESVINALFVEVVPGFAPHPDNAILGIAKLGTNGLAMYVGDNVLNSFIGADHVAGVLAHEIGHNLGLKHTALDDRRNLMNPDPWTQQLSDAQIEAIFQTTLRDDSVAYVKNGGSGFPQLIPQQPDGDYNGNGVVDAADYVIWRNDPAILLNEGASPGVVDEADYDFWRNQFGTNASESPLIASVPEPSSLGLLAAAALAIIHFSRRLEIGNRSSSAGANLRQNGRRQSVTARQYREPDLEGRP
ncbi:MAG TPA: PEP-CTERM sorting domain-containing protein [Lacipirellulaceae bacterium]|nr:PEP-CTERM sorting domain-containing protein [Lacipirellulaceae bacterium]